MRDYKREVEERAGRGGKMGIGRCGVGSS